MRGLLSMLILSLHLTSQNETAWDGVWVVVTPTPYLSIKDLRSVVFVLLVFSDIFDLQLPTGCHIVRMTECGPAIVDTHSRAIE